MDADVRGVVKGHIPRVVTDIKMVARDLEILFPRDPEIRRTAVDADDLAFGFLDERHVLRLLRRKLIMKRTIWRLQNPQKIGSFQTRIPEVRRERQRNSES